MPGSTGTPPEQSATRRLCRVDASQWHISPGCTITAADIRPWSWVQETPRTRVL